MIVPILMCGGAGTRLWPLSRKSYPKQFAPLLGDKSLFQAAAQRTNRHGFAVPLVITGSDYRFIVTEQLMDAELDPNAVLIEPAARNTAPAILAAALHLAQSDSEQLMLVMPADHVIPDADAFCDAVKTGEAAARSGKIVTFGIAPTRPETGYGYLKRAAGADDAAPFPLEAFVEKPDGPRAAEMITDPTFLWNAGIFLFSARTIIDEMARLLPDLSSGVEKAVTQAQADLGFLRLAPEPWNALDDISIDYGVMEKSDKLVVVPFTGAWSDLGGWEAVWQEQGPDADGNALSDHVTALDCSGSLIRSESNAQHVVGIGLQDMCVVAMQDAVLVAPLERTQDVKNAVAALKADNVAQAGQFPKDFRPWGWFESLVIGGRFQVKRIHVHPGAALSLQSHHHRSEHWIVVEGTAKVTIGEEVRLVTENQSVYIPLGEVHRMENPGKVPMVLIEVQTGSYLGEDDIVRYEDVYARS